MFCSVCGSKLESGAAFCTSCGARTEKPAADAIEIIKPPLNDVQVLARQDTRVVPLSYGYFIQEGPDNVTITVPARKPPSNAGMTFLNGCGVVMAWVFGVPLAAGFCALVGELIGGTSGGGAAIGAILGGFGAAAILALLMSWESGKRRKALSIYNETKIVVDNNNIAVNGTVYSRAHVSSWTTRWTNFTGTSTVAVGSSSFVAGAMIGNAIGNAARKKEAEQSYCITFDYGDRQVIAVGGMTEATAGRVMEAIENALNRAVVMRR